MDYEFGEDVDGIIHVSETNRLSILLMVWKLVHESILCSYNLMVNSLKHKPLISGMKHKMKKMKNPWKIECFLED